jgi:hypothetical protein
MITCSNHQHALRMSDILGRFHILYAQKGNLIDPRYKLSEQQLSRPCAPECLMQSGKKKRKEKQKRGAKYTSTDV